MAEAFARAYGSDVITPASAGLSPAVTIAPDTVRLMSEKNLDIRGQYPKSLRQLGRSGFDLIVNMSGASLERAYEAPQVEWEVPDPIVLSYEDHRKIRDQIEGLVMSLILDLRRRQKAARNS
jgi:arsenate reductase (thioredoxin)